MAVDRELAWAAGLFQGSGSSGLYRRKGGFTLRAFITLVLPDGERFDRVEVLPREETTQAGRWTASTSPSGIRTSDAE